MSSIGDTMGRAAALARLHEEIRACDACERAGLLVEARPIREGGQIQSRVMLIGQAPGARSDAARQHFIGPAGATLEKWFEQAGFPPAFFRESVYLTAMTRCFPGKHPAGKGDRLPSTAELALCRSFLDQELDLIKPRLVVLVGMLAISAFLGKTSLTEVVGRSFQAGSRILLPLPHSSPVSRWLNFEENRRRVDQALQVLSDYRVSLKLDQLDGPETLSHGENAAPASHGFARQADI